MNSLCDDICHTIIGYLDHASVNNLSKTSKEWAIKTSHAKVYYPGPKTSIYFTLGSLYKNGPTKMPYVTELDLNTNVCRTTDFGYLLRGLKAIGLESILKNSLKHISVSVNQYSWPECRHYLLELSNLKAFKTLNFYGTFTESSLYPYYYNIERHIRIHGLSALYDNNNNEESITMVDEESTMADGVQQFRTESLLCPSNVFANNCLEFQLKHLTLSNDIYLFNLTDDLESEAIQKAFETKIESLKLWGPFLTDSLINELRQCSSLKVLSLECQSNNLRWINAKAMQKACPALEQLSIRSSNLITSDLDYFDWSLWPRLTSLDVSYNHTLKAITCLPKGLKKLYINNTGIEVFSFFHEVDFFNSIEVLGLNIVTNYDTVNFLRKFTRLHEVFMNLVHYIHGYQYEQSPIMAQKFWSLISEDRSLDIRLKLKDIFYEDKLIESIRLDVSKTSTVNKVRQSDFSFFS